MTEQMTEQTLFDTAPLVKKSKGRKDDYAAFVEKFKPKLTTDDCYTPPAVYDTVLAWVRRNCDIEGCNILRPFYPGGDFEAEEYGPQDVVVDNPPFSIITRIVRWYTARGIRFFLFAPYLTNFYTGRFGTSIITETNIIYDNGAVVKTSFVSNLFGDIAVMSAPDLWEDIKAVQKTAAPSLPKYQYPLNVIRATDIGRLSRYGIRIAIPRSECRFVSRLDSQKNKSIFGGGI